MAGTQILIVVKSTLGMLSHLLYVMMDNKFWRNVWAMLSLEKTDNKNDDDDEDVQWDTWTIRVHCVNDTQSVSQKGKNVK